MRRRAFFFVVRASRTSKQPGLENANRKKAADLATCGFRQCELVALSYEIVIFRGFTSSAFGRVSVTTP
jgi:hypothetical protein